MLTPQDVADKLGVTIWAVYTRIRRGQIGAVNLNEGNLRERSRFLIPKSEVQTTAKPRYAKVTNEQRTLIRQMLDSSDYSLRRIAQQIGVTYAAVRKVAQE